MRRFHPIFYILLIFNNNILAKLIFYFLFLPSLGRYKFIVNPLRFTARVAILIPNKDDEGAARPGPAFFFREPAEAASRQRSRKEAPSHPGVARLNRAFFAPRAGRQAHVTGQGLFRGPQRGASPGEFPRKWARLNKGWYHAISLHAYFVPAANACRRAFFLPFVPLAGKTRTLEFGGKQT